MKTALITGITGQDGSYLAEFLLQKDYRVVGLSRRSSTDTTWRLKTVLPHPHFTLVEGDVTDVFCLYRLINDFGPYEIYNLAAQSHVGTSFQEPFHTFEVTARGCLNVLEAVREQSVFWPKVYQASSSEIFGSSYTVFPEGWGQDETTPFLPNSPYAVAKLAAHNFVRLYREAYGLFACSGILFNHESPRRGDSFVTQKIARWVSSLYYQVKDESNRSEAIRTLLRQGYPRLKLGNLDAQRDWGFAPDYVEAMWRMLQHDTPDDFVIATGETHSVREFVEEALIVIGAPELRAEDVVEFDESLLRAKEVPYLRGVATKAKEKLGWEPQVTFKELVRKMVAGVI